jgi:hypothetical protein
MFLLSLIAYLALLRSPAAADPPPPAGAENVETSGGCPEGVSFEKAGYMIRKARIENFFAFLPWIRAALAAAERGVSALEGKPYVQAEVLYWRDVLYDIHARSDSEQRVRVDVVAAAVENCADHVLDVVYYDFSTEIAPVLGGTIESRRADVAAPERAAGADQATADQTTDRIRSRFHLSPSAGYDRSEGLFGGGHFQFRPGPLAGGLPLDSVAVSGEGSPFMHRVSGAVAGSLAQHSSWLADADWHLDYFNRSEPSHSTRLDQQRGAAELSAMTQPLGAWQIPLRFGGVVEGGELNSDFFHPLPEDTVRNSHYWSSKLFLGATLERARQTLAVSYGVELASTGSADLGWVKHVGDVGHLVTIPVGDHRPLQIESRLAGGLLEIPGVIPVSARFFGGNREEPFISGDSWSIRSNPVIRSIPANELTAARRGPGGTWFYSYNLTVAIPVWRTPLVPLEVSHDPQFTDAMGRALETPVNTLQKDLSTEDPAYERMVARLGDLQDGLGKLEGAVSAAAPPNVQSPLVKSCTRAIGTAKRRAKAAADESKGIVQAGDVEALLSVSADDQEDRLNKVHAACVVDLNGPLSNQAIADAGADVERIRLDMEQDFNAIDQGAAKQKAEAKLGIVRRTLQVLLDETNVIAVSPVGMFDVAGIGPAESGYGTRYGAGGGLRVTLVNSVDFTIAYVANINRHGGESAGAPFFAIQMRDLLN